MACQPIENYGTIGDVYTVALARNNGSMDWLSVPHFDWLRVFCVILDDEKGRRFRVARQAAVWE